MIIGRRGNQPFKIDDPHVGGMHAILDRNANGQYFIIDNNSVNGTFIYNGKDFVRLTPKQPYPVNHDTFIQLGPQTRFHVRRLIPANPAPVQQQHPMQPKQQAPKKADISHLKRISDTYTQQKMKLDSKSQTINGLRSCTILVTLLAGGAGAFFHTQDGDTTARLINSGISFAIALVLMAILLILISNANKKIIRKRHENEETYAVKYVCPECHVSFRGKIYENILLEGSCPRCKTKYYDKNQQN